MIMGQVVHDCKAYVSVFQYHDDNLVLLIWDGYLTSSLVAHCSDPSEMSVVVIKHLYENKTKLI